MATCDKPVTKTGYTIVEITDFIANCFPNKRAPNINNPIVKPSIIKTVSIGKTGCNATATLGRTLTVNGETRYLTPDNWADAAYKNSFRQEYNISARGSMDRGSFYASLGYLDDNGVIQNSSYKRYSGRIKADYQAKKWLKLAANAQFVHSDTEQNPNLSSETGSSANMFYFVSRIAPIYPLYVLRTPRLIYILVYTKTISCT